jgi:hypothetical protein
MPRAREVSNPIPAELPVTKAISFIYIAPSTSRLKTLPEILRLVNHLLYFLFVIYLWYMESSLRGRWHSGQLMIATVILVITSTMIRQISFSD